MKTITIEEALESIKKYGKTNVLVWKVDEFRDNNAAGKTQAKKGAGAGKGAKTRNDCTWVSIYFKKANGDEVYPNIEFERVLAASSAKIPMNSSDEAAKNMTIAFRYFSEEEVATGDYVPKKKDTEEAQEKENKRVAKLVTVLHKNTKDFMEVMEAIDLSYQRCCAEIKSTKNLEYSVKKSKSFKTTDDVTIFSIRQTTVLNKETGKEDKLEYPMTRIKLMLDKDGRVGTTIWNKSTQSREFCLNVYDVRKIVVGEKPVLAKVKVNGKLEHLSSRTAGKFISYRSQLSGTIIFKDITISKFGFSLSNCFYDVYVKRHNNASPDGELTAERMRKIKGSDDEDDEKVEDVEFKSDDEEKEDEGAESSDLEDKASDDEE